MNFLIFLNILSLVFQYDQPSFKGGASRLDAFINNNLIYPEFSKQNCLQGTIQVSFRLNSGGRIYQSAVQKGYGTDLDKEALRIVRLTSGKWIVPAGYDTTQSIVLPINFALKEFNCERRSPEQIREAIAAYRSREALTRAVLNFYDKKKTGNYAADDEAKILDLKAQLGYDERYIDRMLKQAASKIKQQDKEGACEDLLFVRRLGSDRAEKMIEANCK
ncbi:TonB family protein [Hufsiella ginkgonis]|uniref:TonB family protein n=1 Tax=Hufsiella ginkgonis TaxID=2695274 RepID=A0A7K1XTM6_9SPHI|nr:TonB family protein [Hufsiella ginkgonis]MXV14119.1 TonB family protein [Hufsiella ginkgonis]